ncbi:MAG: MFS transporter [Eubacteriales bacterium]|nr:MFS transporter [Eubacteriales bacterium]
MSEQTFSNYRRAKTWQIVLWPLAGGINNAFVILMMFVSYVAAGGYGIAVALAGTIVTGTRIFDAITDPIIALISDRVNTKFGRVRILMAAGFGIMAIGVLTIFVWGIGSNIVVFTLAYMVYIIGYTIYGVAQNSANPILTNDPMQRAKLSRWSTIYTLILSAVPSVYMSMVLFPKYGSLSVEAFQELCYTVLIFSLVLIVIAMIAVSPSDKPENFVGRSKSKVSLRDCWNVLKDNRAMQMYIVAASSDKLALQAASQSAISTMIFGIIIGNYSFSGNLTMINMIPSFIVIFFATHLSGKGGAKKSLIQWTLYSIIAAIVMVAYMTFCDPTQISVAAVPTVIFIALNAIFSALKMATSAITGTMLPDIMDYEMYRSGNFMPATVGAIYSFVDKIISSFATTIVGFCIALIGYKDVMPQPGDPSSAPLFWMAMFLWMGLPILGWICTLIAMKWYPLDKEKMIEVQAANHAAREAAK